jgi:hypothetical protein
MKYRVEYYKGQPGFEKLREEKITEAENAEQALRLSVRGAAQLWPIAVEGSWFARASNPDAPDWSDCWMSEAYAECAYCGVITTGFEAELVPPVDADSEWERLQGFHDAGCEWVRTRAHKKYE